MSKGDGIKRRDAAYKPVTKGRLMARAGWVARGRGARPPASNPLTLGKFPLQIVSTFPQLYNRRLELSSYKLTASKPKLRNI
ncbi:unnamed protein product [Leptosia nina]|uniref:Uncharacterized protein n=1 Tax=Leptosia nina TaxID=320188 RepID=A0AAV1JZE9_9NEOP